MLMYVSERESVRVKEWKREMKREGGRKRVTNVLKQPHTTRSTSKNTNIKNDINNTE